MTVIISSSVIDGTVTLNVNGKVMTLTTAQWRSVLAEYK